MDPLHLAIALGPLAGYFFLLGLVHLARRPLLVRGTRDTAALGAAVAGLAVAGPMELFLPEPAFWRFGPFVWVLALILYSLCVSLLSLMMRPRLVAYNIGLEQLWPVLGETVANLDQEARWAGLSLVLPRLGVSLYVEPFGTLRNVQLIAAGPRQNYAGWRRLEDALAAALRQTRARPNPFGGSLIVFSALIAGLIAFATLTQPEAVVAAWNEMLRL